MDIDRTLDTHLAQALDELLSLASIACAGGRPELALAANAAIDHLLAHLIDDAGGVGERPKNLPGASHHAQH